MPSAIPILSLAPMQDVSVLPLWRCLERRGGADLYVTEYFRVHRDSHPDKTILRSVLSLGSAKPIQAQMIGNSAEDLVRTTLEIQRKTEEAGVPLAGMDLNLGCPAPKVCGKAAGGALLREPDKIRAITHALREVVTGKLTLKTRIGFESESEFDELLPLFAELPIDGLTIHGRTVREKYRTPIHPDRIAEAVRVLPYPVTANGNIVSVETARALHEQTEAAGLMIGRGGIRNPWLFQQIRDSFVGLETVRPTFRDLQAYLEELAEEIRAEGDFDHETQLVHRMKKFTNYIVSGIHEGRLQEELRRAQDRESFDAICRDHLSSDEPFPHEPIEDGTLFCGFPALTHSILRET
ncbi:MAG: tRNA-dihydrouridine synthase family protein [Verrucomicrobiales bacterium]|jgi:tRNA-dihydrouridine synthase C|nr:tRNA-dihydrouridine synthase family protein [Verrucomicrobiales bacterium]